MPGVYDDELKRQLARLPKIRADTVREILRLLAAAEADIAARLAKASQPSAAKLRQQQKEVRAAIERFSAAADSGMQSALGRSWTAGVDLFVKPIERAGAAIGPVLSIDDRSLRAMRLFTTNLIKDVSLRAIDQINSALGGVVLGTTPMSDAITAIQRILGKATRQRAANIAYTNVGMAYSAASYESMQAADALGIPIAKRWTKSGKLHPRPGHVAAHNQIVRVSQPFLIGDPRTGEVEELRYPRDPDASIGNTIHCGCIMIPVLSGSTFGASVIEVPENPDEPIRKISPAARDRDDRDTIARVNDRLARFLSGQ